MSAKLESMRISSKTITIQVEGEQRYNQCRAVDLMEVEEEEPATVDQAVPHWVAAVEQNLEHLGEHLERFVAAVELPVLHTTVDSIACNYIR